MKSSMVWIMIICIVVAICIIIAFSKNENNNSKEMLSDSEINDYIIDLWVNYDENNKYTQEQLVVISLTAYDSEINNGGLNQFFSNSSREFAPIISDSLDKVKALKHKELFDNFIKENKIDLKKLESFDTDNVDEFIAQYDEYPFDEFDSEYYQLESLTNLILAYSKNNYNKIIKK